MTTEQQAKQIIDSFRSTGISMSEAKECAGIAVDLIISANPHSNPLNTYQVSTMGWWNEVKEKVEKA